MSNNVSDLRGTDPVEVGGGDPVEVGGGGPIELKPMTQGDLKGLEGAITKSKREVVTLIAVVVILFMLRMGYGQALDVICVMAITILFLLKGLPAFIVFGA